MTCKELCRCVAFWYSLHQRLPPVISSKVNRITNHVTLSGDLFLVEMTGTAWNSLWSSAHQRSSLFCLSSHAESANQHLPSSLSRKILDKPWRDRCVVSLLCIYVIYTPSPPLHSLCIPACLMRFIWSEWRLIWQWSPTSLMCCVSAKNRHVFERQEGRTQDSSGLLMLVSFLMNSQNFSWGKSSSAEQ